MNFKNIKVVPKWYHLMKRYKYLFKYRFWPPILVSWINDRDAIDTIISMNKWNYISYSREYEV